MQRDHRRAQTIMAADAITRPDLLRHSMARLLSESAPTVQSITRPKHRPEHSRRARLTKYRACMREYY